MTKLNYEKLKRINTGPFYPNTEVSPYQDNKEEVICLLPNDVINDPDYQNYLNSLIGLLMHMSTENYAKKSLEDQTSLFFQLRSLHETLNNNNILNYLGSVYYRKTIKLIEINGLWDIDWRSSEKKLSEARIKALRNLLKHMRTDNYSKKSMQDRKLVFF